MADTASSDNLEPSALASQADVTSRPPADKATRALLFVTIFLMLVNLAAAGGLIMLVLRQKTDTAGGFGSVVDGLNKHVIGGINVMRTEQLTGLAQLREAVTTYGVKYEERANQAVDLITKADNRISEKLQPLFSRIGLAVSEQVRTQIEQTNEQRQLLSTQVATVTEGIKGLTDRLTGVENLLKATNLVSEETRASVLSSNNRLKETLDKVAAGRTEGGSTSDLLAQLEAMNRELASLTKQVASLQSKINRGF